MRVSRLNIVLGGATAVAFALAAALRPDPSRRNSEFLPDMLSPVSYESFGSCPVFADGKTLQAPPEGAIPRDLAPLRYRATPEDALRAGEELVSPFSIADAAALARGGVVYQNYCQVCHGPKGAGDGPVALRGFPAPPPLSAEHARKMRDGQAFHVTTYGQGNMPPYAAQLSREDRWRAVLFVRRLQAQSPVSPTIPSRGAPR